MTNSEWGQDERLRRPATLRSLRLGDTKVSYVPDGAVQLIPHVWLPDTTAEVWATHPEYLDESGNLVGSLGGLLVEHGDRAVLIDAGFGPQSVPADPDNPIGIGEIHGGALLDSLTALGRSPADIEAVAFTHLHIDHLGWAWHSASGSDLPALANAEYLISEPEWAQRAGLENQGTGREIVEILQPRVRTVTDGEEIFPGVRVQVTRGHTAGHACYVINAGEQRVIAFGDMVHSPIQIDHPEWSAGNDHDRELSADYRRGLVAELAKPGTIGFGIHFADVPFGRVDPDADRAWQPVG